MTAAQNDPTAAVRWIASDCGPQRDLGTHLAWLHQALARIERDLDDTIRGSPVWGATEDLLASVPGVGAVPLAR